MGKTAIMRRILKWTVLGISSLVLMIVIGFVVWLWITGGESTTEHIKTTSPFHRYEQFHWMNSLGVRAEMRALVLAELPIGSNFEAIKVFVDRHFIDVMTQRRPSPGGPMPYIYIRSWKHECLTGAS